MAFAIGYNVKEANELMEKIADAYKDLGIYTKDQWQGITDVLQNEWVGEDEQDYEKKLAERLCLLYQNAYSLTNSCVETIAGLAQAWYDFQSKNTLSGEVAEGKGKININKPKIKSDDEIVKSKQKSIGNNDDRGLREASSKTTIQTAVSDFVGKIKEKTAGLFDEIQANTAFFGDQTTNIKTYIDKVGAAIGEVTVAVKDMYNALDTLAATSYTTASSDIAEQFTTASTNVEIKPSSNACKNTFLDAGATNITIEIILLITIYRTIFIPLLIHPLSF